MKIKLLRTFFIVLALVIGFLNPISAQNNQQKKTLIKGQVVDIKGIPLTGVTIRLKNSTIVTVTDAMGNYSLNLAQNTGTVTFSFMGYLLQEIDLASKDLALVTLNEDIHALEEVVVVGYMTQRKVDLTGSIAIVSAKSIEKNSYANVMQGLQGKLAGVMITGDGSPVGNVNIQIRGLTSMLSAPPLIVVDGLPTNVNLNNINPGDISSIQVLKDAASASIYGSRAASGVILIQTKQGKVGGTKVSYDGTVGISSFMNREKLLNTDQYGQAMWQAAINDGRDPNTVTQIYKYDWHRDAQGIAVLDKTTPIEWLNASKTMKSANTDWFKEGSQLGLQNNHQITISHGTETAKTMFSVNFYDNRGTQIYTGFKRYSVRLNTEFDLIKNHLKIGENLSLTSEKINNQNVTHSFLTMPPIIPVYTTDGGWGGTAMGLGMDDYNNPVRMLTQNKDNGNRLFNVLGNIYANLTLFKNLNLKTLYGVDYGENYFRNLEFTWVEGGGKRNITNGVTNYQSHAITRTWTNTLNYNLALGNHKLDFLAGMEEVSYTFEDFSANRRGILFENYDYGYLNSATGNQVINGSGNEWTLQSYFSKFNYEFKNKYLLSATVRYDGSSKFGANNRFGLFPAVSGGWRVSDENFFKKNIKFISNLKLRASWGLNGNSNIPSDALVSYYDANYQNTGYALAGNENGTLASGFRKIRTGNPDLKWESTRQTDVGVDFELFNGTLSGSFDYFNKYTNGMLYQPPYIASIGEGGYQWINAAKMTNKGFELNLTYNGERTKDFSYSITGNISSYHNTINDLPEAVKGNYGGNGLDDNILGRPLNSFYGFVADGLFTTQDAVDNSPEQTGKGLGRIRYKDLDGDGRITWEHDRTWIGCGDPKLMYGANFAVKYKQFDFSMFWQGIAGNIVRDDWKSYSDFWSVWTQAGFNHATRILGAWSPTNTNANIPALSLINANDERRVSTYFMESGSYLKLRLIELGYTFPNSFINKLGISECRFFVNAQNIINFKKGSGANAYTGVDPENPTKADEYSSPYVRPQIFTTGVHLTF